MTSSHRAISWLLPALLASAAVARDRPAVLIDRALTEQRVVLQSISTTTLTYTDARGLVRSESADGYLAVILEGPAGPPPGSVIELADARRIPGRPTLTREPDAIGWEHPILGPMTIPLEEVRRVRLAPGRAAEPAGDNDLALLVNGDRLEGFIESVGESLVMSVGDASITTPLDRVADLVLANPPVPPTGARLWLADGSVLAVVSFESTRVGELAFSLAGEAPSSDARSRVELSSLRAATWSADALIPLAGLSPTRVVPIERRWTRPPSVIDADDATLGAADLLIPGPMRVAWSVPPGVRRFACVAVLPEASRRWGSAELVVRADQAELARVRVDAQAPEHAINVEIPAGARELELALEPGAYGPVQDRVVLRRPLLAR